MTETVAGTTVGVRYREAREAWLTPGRLLSLVAVLLSTYAALTIIRALRPVLVMLLVSLFLSFAMEPAVQWLGRRGWKRSIATAAVFASLAIIVSGIVASLAPVVIDQVTELIRNVPSFVDSIDETYANLPFVPELEAGEDFRDELTRLADQFGDRLRGLALGAAGNVVSIGATAIGAIFQLLAIALVTFYLVADGPRARQALARPFPPERQRELLAIWEIAVAKTGGYIYSRVLLAVVCSGVTAAFLALIGVDYPLPLGVFVGITSAFVPVVGTYLGGVLAILVALIDAPWDAVWVIAFLAVYQQIENYLLAPRVQSQTMDVHPAMAFIAVLAGGTLLGAVGALLALPAAAIIQAVLTTYVRRHELIAELRDVTLPGEGARSHEIPGSALPASAVASGEDHNQ